MSDDNAASFDGLAYFHAASACFALITCLDIRESNYRAQRRPIVPVNELGVSMETRSVGSRSVRA